MCSLKWHSTEPSNKQAGSDIQLHLRPTIQSLTFYVNNAVVAELQLGTNVSHNPIIGIHLTTLKPHDEVSIIWVDTQFNRGTAMVFAT